MSDSEDFGEKVRRALLERENRGSEKVSDSIGKIPVVPFYEAMMRSIAVEAKLDFWTERASVKATVNKCTAEESWVRIDLTCLCIGRHHWWTKNEEFYRTELDADESAMMDDDPLVHKRIKEEIESTILQRIKQK